MKRSYVVTAVLDKEVQVLYWENATKGLHAESETLEPFEALIVNLVKPIPKVSSGSEAAP